MAMTISDDEHREVAARLRALKPWEHFDVGDPIFREEFEEALGLEYVIGDSYDAVCIRRLADLIDRPTTKPEPAGPIYWRCRNCGVFNHRAAVTDFIGEMPARYCAWCGAEVVE